MSDHPTSHELEIRVRYAECDPMGYLHHSRYFVYFEMARTELLRNCGIRYRDMEERGFMFVVAKLTSRFRRPAHYDDLLTLKVRIAKTTKVKIEHEYELYRDGVLLCEASSVLACVDSQGSLIAIPEDIING